jgi:hypothetical protein
MTLKTATLVAIVCLVLSFVIWQVINFDLIPFVNTGDPSSVSALRIVGLVLNLLHYGGLLVFLGTLYLRQK